MEPIPKASASRKPNCFDFLRLLAALAVVVQHSTYHLELPFFWLHKGGSWWFYDGVPLFFIISGLFVYRSCESCVRRGQGLKEYFRNRLLRVCPALYFYAVVTACLLLVLGLINLHVLGNVRFWAWLGSVFFLIPVYNPSFFHHIGIGVLNGSLWTIPVEVSFYVLIPLLVAIARRWNFRTMLLILGALSLVGAVLHWHAVTSGHEGIYEKLLGVTFLPYLVFFAYGVFWSHFWEDVPKSGLLAFTAILGFIALRSAEPITTNYLGPLWGLPLSYATLWIGYHGPALFSRITSRIGDLSYGVYIWHMVVINLFLTYGVPRKLAALPGTVIVLIVIVLSMLMAAVSWWAIERPLLSRKKYSSRQVTASPVMPGAPPAAPATAPVSEG